MRTINLLLFTAVLLAFAGNHVLARVAEKTDAGVKERIMSFAASAESQQLNTPDALLRDLYKVHAQRNSHIVSSKSRRLLDKYFDRNLANLIWKDVTTHRNDIGVIDFDIFYNTQDPLIKNVVVGKPKLSGNSHATVAVSFTNAGAKEVVVYSLVKENGAWKISDIKYQSGNTLLKYFREGV